MATRKKATRRRRFNSSKTKKNMPSQKMIPPKAHFSIWYFLIAFLMISFIHNYYFTRGVENIPYSQFKQLVSAAKVNELVIEEQIIKGKFVDKAKEGQNSFITVRIDDPGLVAELEKKGIKYSGKYESKFISALLSWLIPIGIFFLIWRYLIKKMGGAGASFMSLGKSKAKIFAEDETKTTFDDVAGVDEAKEELQEIIEFLKTPEKFKRLGGRIPKGVLLVGPPGTGKTLLARAVAGEAKVPFFHMSGSDFVEMFVGVGAARVRDLFAQATDHAPCIIFVDELDALGKARVAGPIGGNDEREQTLNQLLVEMDGFDPNVGVVFMAATNRPEILDPALLRPGRFDRHVLVDRPDAKGREEILQIHSQKVKMAKTVDLKVIAARTPGFVGADLANIVNEAALLSARKGNQSVGMKELEEAIDRVVAGLEKKQRIISPREREIVAYHESGHALVASCVPHADPVHRISIIPRGIAALGYTLQLPTEDRYLMTKSELLDRLAVLLGGRVAEELTFGEISTGAQNDLQRATDIATSMVKEYGMGEKLGYVTYGKDHGPAIFPMAQISPQRPYSEETAKEIDQEVQEIIDQTHQRVRTILKECKDNLEKLARLLLEKETVEQEEIKEILHETGPADKDDEQKPNAGSTVE